MKTLKLFSLVSAFLVTICVSPLLTSGKSENPPGTAPLSPKADFSIYLPLLVGNRITTPIPTSTPTSVPNPTSTSVPNPTSTSVPNPTSTPVPDPTATAIPPSGDAIIADHTVIASFSNIPSTYLQAAAGINTLFMHQSTGNNIDYLGLQCLAGINWDPNYFPEECTVWAQNPPYEPYDNRNWDWKLWDIPMSDAIGKTDQWVYVVNTQQQNYQVLGMKFCYVDGWNQDFDYYRQNMEQLEQTYPQKTFIWATSVLWSESEVGVNLSSAENIQNFNQQLRAYARTNNKILYDLADIESHDTNGNICQFNGIEALCNEYYDGFGGGGGGHPDVDGSIRLAQGFWWLMARIGGWDGTLSANQ